MKSSPITKIMALMLIALMCLPAQAMGLMADSFKDDEPSVEVDLDTVGTIDDQVMIPWNYTGLALHGTMEVSPAPHTPNGTDYPLEPSIDVGVDGTTDWSYSGTGYGAYGLQDLYKDGTTLVNKEILTADNIRSPGVLLPQGAQIRNATLTLNGDSAPARYSDDFLGGRAITDVAYSPSLNTVFMAASDFGVLALDMDDGSQVKYDGSSYPKIPVDTIYDLQFEDEGQLLFIATSEGLVVINYSMNEIVFKVNINTEPHSIGDIIKASLYDAETGLLFLGDSTYVTLINLTTGKLVDYIYTNTWGVVESLFYDKVNDMIWVGSRYSGAVGIDMETYEVVHTYSTATTPGLVADLIFDIFYDHATDRLFIVDGWSMGSGGVDIINVGSNTKYASLTVSTTPSLPNDRPKAIQYDPAQGDLYIATENRLMVYDVASKTSGGLYSEASDPSILDNTVYDVLVCPQPKYLFAATGAGVSIINLNVNSKVDDITDFTENPSVATGYFMEHQLDTPNDRVFLLSNYMISILNLSTNEVEANLTFEDIFPPNKCDYFTDMVYDGVEDQLYVGCRHYGQPRVSVYNVSDGKMDAFYDSSTTPSIPSNGYIREMVYDAHDDVLVFSEHGGGIVVLNRTTNTTYHMTTTSSPLALPYIYVNDIVYSGKDGLLIAATGGKGLAIYDMVGVSMTLLNTSTVPALPNDNPGLLQYDEARDELYIAYGAALDVLDLGTMTITASYSSSTDPSVPISSVAEMRYDPTSQQLYIAQYMSALTVDLKNNKVLREYTATSNPRIKYGYVYDYGHYPTEDWDLVVQYGGLQIMKPDPYPHNVALRVNGRLAWQQTDLKTTVTVPDFSTVLQEAMTDAKVLEPDQYGNTMVLVPLDIHSQRAGNITISDMIIEYENDATTNDLADVINDYVNGTDADWDGYIPVSVSINGPGRLVLHDLAIEVDDAPVFALLPEGLWLYENSVETQLMDIWAYVEDEYDADKDLQLQVTAVTNASRVDVGIYGGHYLFVDAHTKNASKDWSGQVDIVITATDTMGFARDSDRLKVLVEPLHDIVIVSEPVTEVMEDDLYRYDVTAESHRNLSLSYELDRAPEAMLIDNATGEITWTPGNDDIGVYAIAINVSDGNTNVYQNFDLYVLPVNDAPVITGLQNLTAFEGVPFSMDLATHITDVDNNISELDLMVQSSYVTLDGLVATFEYPLGLGIGSELVTFIVNDGEAMTVETILITVLGVFSVDPPPAQNVTEGITSTYDMAPLIDNPIGTRLSIKTDSKYMKVNGTILEIQYPIGSGVTEDLVNVTVSDGTAINDTTVVLRVKVTSVFPKVSISEPAAGAKVSGKVVVIGTASISSSQITKVEIKVDNGEWTVADGTISWTYEIDTRDLRNGLHYISVRALVGNVTSEEVSIDVEVKNEEGATTAAGSLLAVGLMIGLIIAILVGVMAYAAGKRKATPLVKDRPIPEEDEYDLEDDNDLEDTESPLFYDEADGGPEPEPEPEYEPEPEPEYEPEPEPEYEPEPEAAPEYELETEPPGPPEAEKPGIEDRSAESEMPAEHDAEPEAEDKAPEKEEKDETEDTLDEILAKLQ